MLRFACALGIVALLCPPLLAQGRLEQVREQVAAPTSSGGSDNSGSSGDDDGLGGLIATLFWPAVLAPFYVPHALFQDNLKFDGYFLPYPYSAGQPGYLKPEPALPSDPKEMEGLNLGGWSGQLLVENGNDFNGLNRFNGTLVLDTAFRLGLRTSWHYFNESLDGGRHDDMVLGDTNLTFRFAQQEGAEMFAGLGVRTLAGPGDTRWGVNFTYGANLYPVKPVVISTVLDLGTLGSATVVHVRGTVGYIYQRWEVFGGYDFQRIGSVNLQGPLVGVRLWF